MMHVRDTLSHSHILLRPEDFPCFLSVLHKVNVKQKHQRLYVLCCIFMNTFIIRFGLRRAITLLTKQIHSFYHFTRIFTAVYITALTRTNIQHQFNSSSDKITIIFE